MDKEQLALLRALRDNLGIVSDACSELKISVKVYHQYMIDSEEFREATHLLNDYVLDFGEKQLFDLMKNGNAPATMFFLKTKAKDRGYGEKSTDLQDIIAEQLSIQVADAKVQSDLGEFLND